MITSGYIKYVMNGASLAVVTNTPESPQEISNVYATRMHFNRECKTNTFTSQQGLNTQQLEPNYRVPTKTTKARVFPAN